MITQFLQSKWTSLFCVFINSVFCFTAVQIGDWLWALFSFGLASLCAYNFRTALERENDQSRK